MACFLDLSSAEEYYEVADFIQRELEKITADSQKLMIPVIGTPQHFTQVASQTRILSQQISLLEERGREAISILNALAPLAPVNVEEYSKISFSSILQEQIIQQVEPFVKYFKFVKLHSGEFNEEDQHDSKDKKE